MQRLYIVELIAVQAEIVEFLGYLKAYISSTIVKEISSVVRVNCKIR